MRELDSLYPEQQAIAEDLWAFHEEAIRGLLNEEELAEFLHEYLLDGSREGRPRIAGDAARRALMTILSALGIDAAEFF